MAYNNTNPYSDALLAYAKSTRYQGRLAPPAVSERAMNRLCGDSVEIFVDLAAAPPLRARFEAEGCALCRASAAMLAARLNGDEGGETSVASLTALVDGVVAAFSGVRAGDERMLPLGLEPLRSLVGFPTRARCVLLPWEALRAMLSRVTSGKAAEKIAAT